MFSIGEFSKITGLTVKTLRFYHEEGLLVPTHIDEQTGYRYYDERLIEPARTIAFLRSLELPLSEIKQLIQQQTSHEQFIDAVARQKIALQERSQQIKKLVKQIDNYISLQREAKTMAQSFEVQEKTIDAFTIAAVRMKARYSECGKGFAKIGRALGRYINGAPLMLHYDSEYKEDDADFEACMPIKQKKEVAGVTLRELPGCRCVTLMHKGPYDQLGNSYAKILQYVKEHGYNISMPTREIYIKGPGMIFKGNPNNYLTEIQIPIES